ncbi:MAG TPA: glycosyltransferase family 4 protein [Actinomycetes bacterium]|nr:glycosyltransferase family 4 protein [Actinomycetes bacterium]
MTKSPASGGPLRIVMLNWRDTRNPEGGGSERYVETVARHLVAGGHQVTIVCAAHADAPAEETRDGVRFVRRGSKLGVYPQALRYLLRRRSGSYDVVVDVQNGMPFLSRLVTRKPVVVLVHHVHREQWHVVYGPVRARIGWWVESRLAPWLYRRSQYVAVSHVTRSELAGLGVDADRIAVVHNGTEAPLAADTVRDPAPHLCVLGRLVPHKRVEHALEALARLRPDHPDARLTVLGHGWWDDELRAVAHRLGVDDAVEFTGRVDETEKHVALARSWVLLTPSLKEGWGLCITEAASHGVPSVAYRSAGGVAESVVDGGTGLLVEDDLDAFVAATRRLLDDAELRQRLGTAARDRSTEYSWDTASAAFLAVLRTAVAGRTRHDSDAVEGEPVRTRDDRAGVA